MRLQRKSHDKARSHRSSCSISDVRRRSQRGAISLRLPADFGRCLSRSGGWVKYTVTKEFWKISALIDSQISQWRTETGDCPTRISLRKELFDRLCAENADLLIRKDK